MSSGNEALENELSLEDTLARFAKTRRLLKGVYTCSELHFDKLRAVQRDDFSRIEFGREHGDLFLSKVDLYHLKKVVDDDPVIIVSGQTNCGKTSLVNELLSGSYLPTSAIPCTARVVRVLYSEENYLQVFDKEHKPLGQRFVFEKKKIPEEKINLDANSRLEQNVVECIVEVGLNSELLQHGVQIMDIPGLSENEALDDLVMKSLDGMLQLIIYVIDGKKSLSQPDIAFLSHLKNVAPKAEILYVCNKVEDDPVARKMDKFSGDEDDEERPDRAKLAFEKLKKSHLICSDTMYSTDLAWYHGLSCTSIRKARVKKKGKDKPNEYVHSFNRFRKALLAAFSKCVNVHLIQAVLSLYMSQCRLFDFYISDKFARLPNMNLQSHIKMILEREKKFQAHLEGRLECGWFDMIKRTLEITLDSAKDTILEAVKDLEFQPITLEKKSGANHVLISCRLQVQDFVLMMVVKRFEVDLKHVEIWFDKEAANFRYEHCNMSSGVDNLLQHHLASIWDRQGMNFDISALKDVWVAGLRQSVKTKLKQGKEYVEMRFKGIYLNQQWKQETAADILRSICAESITNHILNAIRDKLRKDHGDFQHAMRQISSLCRMKEEEAVFTKRMIKDMVPSYSKNLCITEALVNTLQHGAVVLGEKIGEGSRCDVFDCPGYANLSKIVVKKERIPTEQPNYAFSFTHCYSRMIQDQDVNIVKVVKLTFDSQWHFCMILPKLNGNLYQLLSARDHGLALERRIMICYEMSKICIYVAKLGVRLNDLRLNNFLVQETEEEDGELHIIVSYNNSKWRSEQAPYPDGIRPFHFAPEVIIGKPSISRTSDAYSLTVQLMQLAIGHIVEPDFNKDPQSPLSFLDVEGARPEEKDDRVNQLAEYFALNFYKLWEENFPDKDSVVYTFVKSLIKKYIATRPRDRAGLQSIQQDLKTLINRMKEIDQMSSSSSSDVNETTTVTALENDTLQAPERQSGLSDFNASQIEFASSSMPLLSELPRVNQPSTFASWSELKQSPVSSSLRSSRTSDGGATSCRDVVELIRREEFGIGMVLNDDARKLLTIQQERIGRSLDRLSKDLYSKDTHFVLELIQNADDNSYPENLVDGKSKSGPALQFVVNDNCIVVLNNETGFVEKNIRAICDVGKSTKGKHSGGYIGQKGIGFKSVFRISDRPEIHSNGYHIYFDVKSGPMGYILPHWTDEVKSEKDWMTKIILPLKRTSKENDAQQVRSLANRFYDIHPSLLLFLRRLRQIVIVHENDKEVLRMSRRDVGKNVIEIRHNNGTDKWLVIKKQLDATKISLQAKSGVDIASTDVALAFPILPTEQAVPPLPPKQPLFAFLPLRSYGFRFVVQGDFDVPSSREDVDSDSTWNQWLRSEIPTVFVDALDVFTNHPSLDLLEGVLNYLQFVPMEDELLDFFKPVSLHILSRLRTKPCLPVVPAEGDALSWRLPSQIIVTQDHHVLELISARVLEEHLGLYYLHPKVAKNAQFPLLKSLGVRTLNTQHLLEVGRSLIKMWTDREEKAELPADVITSLARWFLCLARSLDDFANHKDDVRYIQTLDLMPLADGSMTSLVRSTVFFPPEESDDEILTMRLLLGDFCMLDYRLISSLDHVSNLTVRQLLSQLGVRDASPYNIVTCHVLPVLKTDQWKEKDRHILEAYVHHIHHLYTTEPDRLDMNDVTSCVRLWTNQGALNPLSSPVHFSVYYKNPVDLCKVFPGQPWFLVDKCYLRRKMNPENIELWRQFLQAIGVTDFLIVREVTETKTVMELENSPFAGDVEDLTNCTGPFIMKDYVSPELRALVESSNYDHVTEMAQLAELMDKFFHQYEHAMNASLCDSDGKVCRSADSSFRTLLRSAQWLPGKTVLYSIVEGSLTCERDVKLYSASELFLPQNTLRHCLSDHVPYLQTKLSEKTPFLKELGITHTLDVDLMVQFLLKWSERKFFAEPVEFITSVGHMMTVYAFLHDNMPRNTIRTIFKQHPVVFVPRKSPVQEDLVSAGDFHRLCDVIWSDPTGIFFKYSGKLKHERIVALNEFYPSLERFFVDLLNLNKHPTLMNYVEALKVVAEPFLAHGSNVGDCFTLMQLFGQRLRSMEEQERTDTVAELKSKLKGLRFIPMKRVAFACLEDRPMIPDTAVLDMFYNPDQEDLINVVAIDTVDENDGPRRKEKFTETNFKYNEEELLYFLESLGVERASVCMEQTYTHNNAVYSQHLQIYFHKIVPAVQKMRKLTWTRVREFRNVFTFQLFLYNDHRQCYQQLHDDGVADKFAQMQFYQVAELHSVFTITHTNLRHQRREKVLIYDDENALYIHEQHMDAFSDLHKELARYLSYGNTKVASSIREFVTDLLPMVQGENVVDMEVLCRQRSWQPLPPGEIQWVVQMPELEKEEKVEVEEEVEDPEREVDVDMEPDNGILDQDEPLDHVVRMEDEEESCEMVGSVAWPPVPSRKENTEGKKTVNKVFTEEEGHKDMRNAVPLFRGQKQQTKYNSQSTPAQPPLPVSSGWREKSSENAYQTAPRPVIPFDDTKPDKNVNLWGPRPVWWASEWPPSVDYIGPAPVGWIGPWPPRKEPWGEKPSNYNGLWPPPAYAVGTPPTDWKDDWPPQATIWGDKPPDWNGKWPPPHEYIGPAPSTWLGPWPPSSAWMTGHAEIWQRCGGQQEAQESKVEVPDQTQASSYWLDKSAAKSEDDHWEEVPADEVDQLDHEHYRYERYDGKLWRKQIPYGVSGESTLTGVTFGPWEIFDGKDFDEYYYEYACVDGYNYRRKIIRPKRKWTDRQNRREEGNGDDDFGPWEAFNGTEKDEAKYEYYEEGGYCYRRRRKQAVTMPSGEKRGFWEPCDSTMAYDEQIFEYCRDAEGKQFRRRLVTEVGGPRWQLCTQSADINDSRFVYHMEAGKLYRCEANLASSSSNSAATHSSSDWTTVLKPKGVRQFTAKASPGDLDLANVMDDIALGREILLPRKVLLDSAQGMTNLGRYGENLVFHHLLQNKYVFPGHKTMEIVWVNENDERGEPFDILIRMENQQSRSLVQLFIEVKATMTEDKDLFEITGREVQFAYQKGEYYHLYRVYNANDPDKVRIARIKNLAMKIDQKMVKLCMVI